MTLVVYDIDNIKTSNREVSKISRKFDIMKLKEYIEEKNDDSLFSHVVYLGVTSYKTDKFKNFLVNNDFEVITKKAKTKKCTYKGMRYEYKDIDMDAKIVSNTVKKAKDYQNVIFVSGDGDFFSMLLDLRREGKYVKVISWEDNLARKIVEVFDCEYLDDIAEI